MAQVAQVPPLGRINNLARHVPNALSATRLAGVPLVAVAFARQEVAAGLVLLAVLGVTDVLDGSIARWLGATSVLGAHLDSAADKLLGVALLAGLAVSGAIAPATVAVLASVSAVQVASVVCRLRGAERNLRGPKTLVGPVLGVLLILCSILEASPFKAAVEASMMVLAVNGAWWYQRAAPSDSQPDAIHRAGKALSARNAAWMRSYGNKLQGLHDPSKAVLTVPNLITAFRLVLGLWGLYVLWQGFVPAAIALGTTFIALDIADGFIARTCDRVTVVGRYFDAIVDKSVFGGFITISVVGGWLPPWLAAIAGFRLALIAAAAGAAAVAKVRPPRNWWSPLANVTLVLSMVVGHDWVVGLAVVSNAQNTWHYAYHVGQCLLSRQDERRNNPKGAP